MTHHDPVGGRRVVVTGAAGLIGRVVVSDLSEDFEIVALTHRPAPFESAVVELSDLSATTRAFEGAWAIVHLAAAAELDADWASVLRDNIVATYNVLEAARRCRVHRVVLASSHHVVGMYEEEWAPSFYDPDDLRSIAIEAPVRPDSLYAVSKLFGENLGRYYHDRWGLSVICLRLGVVRDDDDPASESVATSAPWLDLPVPSRYARAAAVWLSKRDAARLVRSALRADAPWSIVFGTSANQRLLWDATSAREIGFQALDGAVVDKGRPSGLS